MADITAISKLSLLLLFFCKIKNGESIGWNDVCQINASAATCYIWPENPAPWNTIDTYLNSAICDKTCVLKLCPFKGTCSTLLACQNSSGSSTIANTPFSIIGGLQIRAPFSQIQSMSETTSARIQISADQFSECNAFKVFAENVSFSNIDFSVDNSCNQILNTTSLSAYVPILYYAGGIVSLKTLKSASPVSTVLFIGKMHSELALIALSVNTITMGPVTPVLGAYAQTNQFSVMLLNVSTVGSVTCDLPGKVLLVQQQFQQLTIPNTNCVTNLTQYYKDVDVDLFSCPSVTVTKETNCHKRAATQLVLIIILVILILVGVLILLCQGLPKLTNYAKTGISRSHQKAAKAKEA